VQRTDLISFLLRLVYYTKFFWLFDVGIDHHMDFQEWHWYRTLAGEKMKPVASRAEFNKVDKTASGHIQFEAFCAAAVDKQVHLKMLLS